MIREFEVTILINADTKIEAVEKIKKSFSGINSIKQLNRRTALQNRSLHKYYSLLAEALNDGGFEMQKVIRQSVEIPWTGTTVKEILWRPLQKAYKLEHSTTRLKTTDIDKIYLVLDRAISERTGVTIPFPSIDSMSEIDYT